ncbi:MAG: zinc ribbon domain-containing protein [Ruminococcus sp.]|nr:zinc ribbon domain-containing protein [Ruminococcus sp.]
MYNQYPQPIPMDLVRKNRLSVKSYLRNSNVLTLAVLYIISTVAAIITQILSAPIMSKVISNLAYEMDFDYPISVSSGFSIPILPVLMIISFFLLYSAGKKGNPDTPNTAGAVILMVISIIQLVLLCLAILGVILLLVLAIIFCSVSSASLYTGSPYYYSYGFINGYVDASSVAIIVLSITLVIVIGIFTLALIQAIGMVRFTNSLRKGLNSPELSAKGAKAVGVCNVIYAIFSGIGMIFTPVSIMITYSSTPYLFGDDSAFIVYTALSTLTAVLSFIIYISMAKFAFGFNKHVKAELYNTTYNQPTPPYSAPVEPAVEQNTTPYYVPQQETANQDTIEIPMSSCPACGEATGIDQAFCSECGYKLK